MEWCSLWHRSQRLLPNRWRCEENVVHAFDRILNSHAKEEMLTQTIKKLNPEDMALSKISHSQRAQSYMTLFTWDGFFTSRVSECLMMKCLKSLVLIALGAALPPKILTAECMLWTVFHDLKLWGIFCFLFCFSALAVGPGALCIPDNWSTSELQPQPLESQAVVTGTQTWGLGPECQSFGRMAGVLHCRYISLAQPWTFKARTQLLLCLGVIRCGFIVLPTI